MRSILYKQTRRDNYQYLPRYNLPRKSISGNECDGNCHSVTSEAFGRRRAEMGSVSEGWLSKSGRTIPLVGNIRLTAGTRIGESN